MFIFALVLFVACEVPGARDMGDACDVSEDCVGEGACLKGVCSAYGCDDGCSNGLECGSVMGVAVCVQSCTADSDCEGGQACSDVDATMADDSAYESICL